MALGEGGAGNVQGLSIAYEVGLNRSLYHTNDRFCGLFYDSPEKKRDFSPQRRQERKDFLGDT